MVTRALTASNIWARISHVAFNSSRIFPSHGYYFITFFSAKHATWFEKLIKVIIHDTNTKINNIGNICLEEQIVLLHRSVLISNHVG